MRSRFWKKILLLVTVLCFNYSCAATLQLSSKPKDPIDFYLTDHGRHSSLIFPLPLGQWQEFTYGEWEWFAQNNDSWYRVPAVLFWPTKGTLGRRTFSNLKSLKETYHSTRGVKLIALQAERNLLTLLRERLTSSFKKSSNDTLFNSSYHLSFIPYEDSFHIFHLCNHEISMWLQEVNYEVKGMVTFADWKIE